MSAAGHPFDTLSAADVGLIHSSALQILEQMGMVIQNQQLLQVLAEHGAHVDVDAERATFPRALVEKFIAGAPKIDWETPARRVRGTAGVYESQLHDPESGELVP